MVELDLVLCGPLVLVGFSEESVRPVVADVVDEDVDCTARDLGRDRVELLDGRRLPDVARNGNGNGNGRPSTRFDVGHSGTGQFGVDVVDHHSGACRGEESGRAAPDATPTTGDHRGGSRQ